MKQISLLRIRLALVAATVLLPTLLNHGEAAAAEPPITHASASAGVAGEPKAAIAAKMCSEHNLPETECGICHPERAAKLKPGEGSKVRMPAADSASIVGVEMAQATVGDISESIECYAELAFNQNRLAQIAAPVAGILQSVDVDLGAKV